MKGGIFKRMRAGFTLAESLIAIGILAMLAVGIAALSTTVFSTKDAMMEAGECRTLGSTAMLAVADEIRYGQNVREAEEDGESFLLFDSETFGKDVRFSVEDGRIWAVGAAGKYAFLTDKYYGDLSVGTLTVRRAGEGSLAEISISVFGGREEEIWSAQITVEALNGIG